MPDAVRVGSGKVRDLYALDDDRLLLVASDRLSTYDVVLPTEIPDKGRVLSGLSAYWFTRLRDLVPNHFVALRRDGRSIECVRLTMFPVEFVVRGFLAGSAWVDYRETGEVCGHRLAGGLRESERLPAPILTPATKSDAGHDLNISEAEAAEVWGVGCYEASRAAALALYASAAEHAASCGIIVADTKFEFGVDRDGTVTLGDEALTPDSSRFWPLDGYGPGRPQPSFDKQYARDWCASTGWDRTEPGPELPPDVVAGTRARYVEAFEQLTGVPFDRYLDDPGAVLCD
jgi:phosphoribosylaminoimidazole-succinocarboxamide synthase